MLHFTASFAAVCRIVFFLRCCDVVDLGFNVKGTVATTVCSPADVLKVRILVARLF
jgi:hypothetical protein